MISKFIKDNPKAMLFSSFQISHNLSTGIVVPFFSLILLEANWKIYEITYFFAFFTLASFIFSPIIGRISDEIGRKKIILFGVVLQIIFMISYYYFTDYIYLIYLIRFLDGIGSACIVIVTMAAFEDLIKEKRGFWTGLFLSLGTIGTLIGPIIAGLIAGWYYAKILLLASSIFAIFSIILLIIIPEKKINKSKVTLNDFNPISEIKTFLKFRELKGMAFLGILMNSKNQIYIMFFPILVIVNLGFSETSLGFLLSIPIFFHIFQIYFGKISEKISAEFGVLLGVFLVSLSFLFFPYANTFSSLLFLLLIYGIGGSIWNVNAWSLMGEIAKEKNMEGEIVGTYSSISKIGVFITILISAKLVELFGITGTLQLFSIIILFAIVIVYFLFFQPVFHHKKNKSYFHKVL